jgi:hypothetical protein
MCTPAEPLEKFLYNVEEDNDNVPDLVDFAPRDVPDEDAQLRLRRWLRNWVVWQDNGQVIRQFGGVPQRCIEDDKYIPSCETED